LIRGHYLASEGRYPYFEPVFIELLLVYKEYLFDHPGIFSHLGNATLKLSKIIGSGVEKWAEILKRCTFTNDDVFIKTGYIAAWICGCASYRENALKYLPLIDKRSFVSLFGLNEARIDDIDVEEIIRKLRSNPWTDPVCLLEKIDSEPVIFKTTGGFKGFGNTFIHPPRIFEIEDEIFITDNIYTYQFFADVFGQQLIKTDPVEPLTRNLTNPERPISFLDGWFYYNDRKIENLPKLNLVKKSEAFANKTYLLSAHNSYKIFIFGLSDKVGDSI